jgi:hypothetical protein
MMMNNISKMSNVMTCKTEDGNVKNNICIEVESFWLTFDQAAGLFQKTRLTINQHVLNFSKIKLDNQQYMRLIGKSN